MSTSVPTHGDTYLSRSDLGRRYGRCARTMKRWKEENKLPKPDLVIGDREL